VAPIYLWFEIGRTPLGEAPEHVRDAWVGVPLPVRRPRPAEAPVPMYTTGVVTRTELHLIGDAVVVTTHDAVTTLRFYERDDAADWWLALLRRRGDLVFRANEGRLLPPPLAMALRPELLDLVALL
jgi:hypothetical protein